jgi:hypothetical protein
MKNEIFIHEIIAKFITVGAQGARYEGIICYRLQNVRKKIFEIILVLY